MDDNEAAGLMGYQLTYSPPQIHQAVLESTLLGQHQNSLSAIYDD